jgi:hypothetical protein
MTDFNESPQLWGQSGTALALLTDHDRDVMPDAWEIEHARDPTRPDREEDPDFDPLT